MQDFILTLILVSLSVVGMAIGVILSNKKLKGSCGGLGQVLGEDCDFCESRDECPELKS